MKGRLSFALAFVVLLAVAVVFVVQRHEPPRPTGKDAYSDGGLGHAALPEAMETLGVHVLVDRRGVHAFADAPVFFIEPALRTLDRRGDRVLLEHALARRARLGVDSVLVLPKWRPGSEPSDPVQRSYKPNVDAVLETALPVGLVELRREDTDVPETAMLREWTVPSQAGPRRVVLLERQTLRVLDRRAEVLLGTRRSALIVRYRPPGGHGSIFVVSDPDLLHNFNLQRGDHAQIVLDLLHAADSDTIVLDEVFHGHAFADTTATALGASPAAIVVAHLFGLVVLFLWAGAVPFGGLARRPGSSSASSQLLSAAGEAIAPPTAPADPALVGGYITLVIGDVAERLGVHGSTSLQTQARHVDEIAGRRGVEGGARALLDEARDLPRSRHGLLGVARRAHAMRERLLQLKGTR